MWSDFHVHSVYSDGELIPAEIARRCVTLKHTAVGIADHVDNSNLEFVLKNLVGACDELSKSMDLEILPGVEITHVPVKMISTLVKKAKSLGARIIAVHGESPVEPVQKGTNLEAVKNQGVNLLAHPGFITIEEAELARENGIYLELTSRSGHCLANGHVARVAIDVGAKLLVNSDAHSPEDLIDGEMAFKVALGSGLSKKNSEIVTGVNSKKFLGRI